jgi:hypothetical protein
MSSGITYNPDGSVASVNGVDFNSGLIQPDFSGLSTSFPTATGNTLNFNTKQFISDLAYASGKDDWNGFIRNDPLFLPTPSTSQFANTGDPRYRLSDALQDVYNAFVPRQQAVLAMLNAGGCQIINNYVCDADGFPIAESSYSCSNITLSGGRIQPNEVVTFVKNAFASATQNQADNFIAYIKNNYISNGYTVSLLQFTYIHSLIVQLNKNNSPTVSYKYFYDQADYLANQFNVTPIVQSLGSNPLTSFQSASSFVDALKSSPMIF